MPRNPTGMSLIELLVAISIGSVLMVGLLTVFSNSSRSHRELEKSSQLIENGRYAVDVIYEDLRHAGYYGHFYELPAAPAALPDPCETSSAANLLAAMSLPIQGYKAVSLSTRPDIDHTNTCETALLTSANLTTGSDLLIIRRADTNLSSGTSADDTTVLATKDPDPACIGGPCTGRVYIQSNMRAANIQIGNNSAGAIDPTDLSAKTADNVNQSDSSKNMQKFPAKPSTTWADIRQYHVHLYFIAPCSMGTGVNGVCQSGDEAIPTLKRLELTDNGSGSTVMKITPLVEGIEYMKLEYGIDNNPTAINPVTRAQGDGIPDAYVTAPAISEWPQVVSVRVNLLSRTLNETQGYSDAKVYSLAGTTIPTSGTFGDKFKRHVFTAEVRPVNLSGRREIPQ